MATLCTPRACQEYSAISIWFRLSPCRHTPPPFVTPMFITFTSKSAILRPQNPKPLMGVSVLGDPNIVPETPQKIRYPLIFGNFHMSPPSPSAPESAASPVSTGAGGGGGGGGGAGVTVSGSAAGAASQNPQDQDSRSKGRLCRAE